MPTAGSPALTDRLRLRPFDASDRDWFAALHADAEVMRDVGAKLSRHDSFAKLDHYIASASPLVIGRLAVETKACRWATRV